MIQRIVVRNQQGLRVIVGSMDLLNNHIPSTLAYGKFQTANLERVEKNYVLYREVAPKPVEDDGA